MGPWAPESATWPREPKKNNRNRTKQGRRFTRPDAGQTETGPNQQGAKPTRGQTDKGADGPIARTAVPESEEGHEPALVLLDRIELSTSPLPRECSTTELQQRAAGLRSQSDSNAQPVLPGGGWGARWGRGAPSESARTSDQDQSGGWLLRL